jgi:hypothetical protein
MKAVLTLPLLTSIIQQVKSWFEQAKTPEPEDDLIDLPDTVQAQLAQKLQALSSPEVYQTAIQTDIAAAVQTWQQNLDAPNTLIFLGNPVEPIAKILTDSLVTWSDAPVQVMTPLPCLARPQDPLTMVQQIRQALEPWNQTQSNQADEPLDDQSLEKRTTLIMVPCLEQCFLRCIGGWESIELLRDIAIHNRDYFWVFGCNRWAWDFLDFTNQISAYFSEVKGLPELDAAMLQHWLNPIAQPLLETNSGAGKDDRAKANAWPDSPSEDNAEEESSDKARLATWKILASLSAGVGQIAANLWLQSLRLKAESLDADQSPPDQSPIELDDITDDEQNITLQEIKSSLPSLPSLDNTDRYLLHSLLIHGAMSRAHLALSLGELENQVQAQVQRLLREKVLVQGQGALSIRAVHYTKLKAELANNNFFVGKD